MAGVIGRSGAGSREGVRGVVTAVLGFARFSAWVSVFAGPRPGIGVALGICWEFMSIAVGSRGDVGGVARRCAPGWGGVNSAGVREKPGDGPGAMV